MQVLVPRIGQAANQIGVVLITVGVGVFLWTADQSGTAITSGQMILPLALMGLGMGLIVAPVTRHAPHRRPQPDAGSASGLINTTQQLGAALGIALICVVFFGPMNSHAANSADPVSPQLRARLVAAQMPSEQYDAVVAGFRASAIDRADQVDPADVSPGCRLSAPSSPAVSQALADLGRDAPRRPSRPPSRAPSTSSLPSSRSCSA